MVAGSPSFAKRCAFFALRPRAASVSTAIFAQRMPSHGKRWPHRNSSLIPRKDLMDYAIVFATAAMVALYVLIISRCLPKHNRFLNSPTSILS